MAGADVPHLMEVVEGFLRSLASLQSRAVVVIDEAQSLSPTLLDEVRMLTAFEKDGRRLIQIVLCGQPMLLNTLKTEPMYALNERITRRVALTPLSPAEVESYIYHRLAIAGGADAVSFQPDAMKLVAELSRGLPRRVNVLCDRTLQESRAVSATVISSDLVKRAAKSLAGSHPTPTAEEEIDLPVVGAALSISTVRQGGRLWRIIGSVAAGALLLGGLAYWYFGGQILDAAENFSMPARANVPTMEPVGAIPVPTDAALEAYFREMARGIGGGGGGLAQLPHDRDQLD
jgi:general secretion pathway protein A